MEIFNKKANFEKKVNFVDENNVFVGYDLGQHCCEDADWFIDYSISSNIENERESDTPLVNVARLVKDYVFDASFFKEITERDDLHDGAMAVFKLVSSSKEDLYLHLYNIHNGYYSHGFEVKVKGETVRDGII